MKHAVLITVGNELLSGYTVDTNAAYLGRCLLELGMPLMGTLTVPDEEDKIVQALEQVSKDADLILLTGGLGPTEDDLTRHALAQYFDVELVLHPQYVESMQAFFAQRQRTMPERNTIQAQFPAGAQGIDNHHGTAPGIMVRRDHQVWAALPGVPSEMKPMFDEAVVPIVREMAMAQSVVTKRLRCFGVGESFLAERLGQRMARNRNPLINCTVDHGVITLHVVASADQQAEAETLAGEETAALHSELGDWVFGQEEETLAGAVGQLLVQQDATLATAESCTGGWISKLLTDIPGASAFFTQGWITYTNRAKTAQLGVPNQEIEQHGAVSGPVARAMAMGARERAGADYALAVSGIAGPTGSTPDKPVGLVFIAVDTPNGCKVKEYRFARDRSFIRFRTAQTALNDLRRILLF